MNTRKAYRPFSGSYAKEDCLFLLTVIEMPETSLEERERLIQSGHGHYSEMIGYEKPPSESYLKVFYQAMERNLERLARDVLKVSARIAWQKRGEVTLLSVARSGTPIGVALKRALSRFFGRKASHYSISVIRDKGLDYAALRHVLGPLGHSPDSIAFVDGWTGKGVIAQELRSSLESFNREENLAISPDLCVLSDLAGQSGISGGFDDYLIPSSVLNSVVSGLVSRTILNRQYIGPGDFHGCLFYDNMKDTDLSVWFVDRIMDKAWALLGKGEIPLSGEPLPPGYAEEKSKAANLSSRFMGWAKRAFAVEDDNLIKPGLGEATRVLLRRRPEVLLARDLSDGDIGHLLYLAKERGTPVKQCQAMPYRAAAIIRDVKRRP